MESAISADSLTPGFSPSAVRSLTGSAQMSQYSGAHCSPYSSIFNVSSVLAEHLNASRVQAFGLSPVSAAAMLHNRIPDPHHSHTLLSLPPESATNLNICANTPIVGNVMNMSAMSDLSSPAPSTDGDSIGDQYQTEDSITSAPEDTKLFTLKRAIHESNHFGSKAQECNPSFVAKEQENSSMNGNKSRCSANPKKTRIGKTVSIAS